MTEPPEVEADELAAAEEWLREGLIIGNGERMRDVLMAEYDRMRAELHAREFAASYQAATIGRLRRDRDKLQVDLARALPVVEAAEALVEHFGPHSIAEMSVLGQRKFKALAREVRP